MTTPRGMHRFIRRLLGALLVAALLLLTACSGRYPGLNEYPAEKLPVSARASDSAGDASRSQKLVVWSYYDMSGSNSLFQSRYPDVRLETRVIDYNNVSSAYMAALSSDSVPDIMILDSGILGEFNGLDVFVDLNDPALGLASVITGIPDNLLPMLTSFDRRRLIAVPASYGEALTFYREDLLRSSGLPSEPGQVAALLRTPEGWLSMARTLKRQGIYIFQKNSDPLDIAAASASMFSENLEFNRDGAGFIDALNTARSVKQEELALGATVWDQWGQEALRSGKLAMYVTGQWGSNDLKSWVPEQSGKWRATRLPLGLYGTSGGAVAAITKQSAHKDLAAQYLKRIVNLGDKGQADPYLGGQNTLSMILADLPHLTHLTPTPLDRNVNALWEDSVREAVESDLPAKQQWQDIGERFETQTEQDRTSLLMRLDAASRQSAAAESPAERKEAVSQE
ncbi:extracellular solute-binding protein [Paenibacillus spiritus]|uniref:Extracellular solute-binding protein n=1 Tax=Paenibacillus spiritus TaxID=2496557 RepID=A0A5J5G099_9BACL|nr:MULTISPECIES: extracellular solute-binding protein [Paenibacillus]KAA8999773.1 extracellular solute-binding protein [Paenibacillus spiritus]